MWAILGTIFTGLLAAGVGLYTARKTFRSSSRTADTQRDIARDQRADAELTRVMGDRDQWASRFERISAENERLQNELDRIRGERNDYAERYARLRVAVIEHDLDPDAIVGRPGEAPPPPAAPPTQAAAGH